MELSPTAFVILGMLAWRPMSGYDVKSIVDNSTRFFWAASYGQIYPELRRLAEAGYVEGAAEEGSGRKRTAYRITADGREALAEWLAREPRTFEYRDEGLLKLFFASASPETAVASLEAKRAFHESKLAQLREIEAEGHAEGFVALVLRYGIESSEWMAGWCEREAERLRTEAGAAR
jgi:PadR family transcriptional regulator, regulatory protein AphA